MKNFKISPSKRLSGSNKERFSSFLTSSLKREIRKNYKTLDLMKKVISSSKVLRKLKVDGDLMKFHSDPRTLKSTKRVIFRLTESLKNHPALVSTDFSMGEFASLRKDIGINLIYQASI